ncbi:hypothetical protein ROHU_034564 [Labeo rohita]|uniref:Uncharacterized protein n=1 Tax=Labeo rohita TaxID=84645 RepID=A0A498L4E6_LABRO|nr:hypothetical protein ROHU_034564 [Labeo rohita]
MQPSVSFENKSLSDNEQCTSIDVLQHVQVQDPVQQLTETAVNGVTLTDEQAHLTKVSLNRCDLEHDVQPSVSFENKVLSNNEQCSSADVPQQYVQVQDPVQELSETAVIQATSTDEQAPLTLNCCDLEYDVQPSFLFENKALSSDEKCLSADFPQQQLGAGNGRGNTVKLGVVLQDVTHTLLKFRGKAFFFIKVSALLLSLVPTHLHLKNPGGNVGVAILWNKESLEFKSSRPDEQIDLSIRVGQGVVLQDVTHTLLKFRGKAFFFIKVSALLLSLVPTHLHLKNPGGEVGVAILWNKESGVGRGVKFSSAIAEDAGTKVSNDYLVTYI